MWEKAREKEISKRVREKGCDAGETEDSLPIGNSSSSQAAEKKDEHVG